MLRFSNVIMSIKSSIKARDFTSLLLTYCLAVQCVLSPLVWAQDSEPYIQIDTSRSPTVQHHESLNGVDVIDIATPHNSGLSENYFRAYSVPDTGVIVNNNTELNNPSQLGGIVNPNRNLQQTGPASTILFDVTGTDRTQLNGMTEIHGGAANFILSNPNGISVNGGAFYNAPRVTLTTGEPIVNANQLTGFVVNDGRITIDSQGLITRSNDRDVNVTAVDLLARSIELNGEIYAPDLTLVTGRNEVAYDDIAGAIIPLDLDETGKPQFAIDSSQLWGMYANAIRLVSTEQGVGVRFRAPVAAG